MYPTLVKGDYILVNKQIPGPRVYRNIRRIRYDGKVQTKRFKGIRSVKQNDILVFNYPYSDSSKIDMDINVNYVKRCVAIPGDTFYIENNTFKVNNATDKVLGYRIPAKGSNLTIDTINYVLYKNLITYETGKQISVLDGAVFLGDSIINRYSFEMNYYFMAGDNVLESADSRYWGLLPEDHIIGKAVIIWKSKDMNNKIRWNRIFKLL